MKRIAVLAALGAVCFFLGQAHAADIPYKRTVTLKVGQSVILKGVRGDCGGDAPAWGDIAGKLPKPKTGVLSNGGTGTVNSKTCGGRTPGRAVRFTAKTTGKERFTIFDDGFSVTVQ